MGTEGLSIYSCIYNTHSVKHDRVISACYLHSDGRLIVSDVANVFPPAIYIILQYAIHIIPKCCTCVARPTTA